MAAAASSGSATFSLLLPWDPKPECAKCDLRNNTGDSLHEVLVLNARLDALKLCNEKTRFLSSSPDICYVLEQLALSTYPINYNDKIDTLSCNILEKHDTVSKEGNITVSCFPIIQDTTHHNPTKIKLS